MWQMDEAILRIPNPYLRIPMSKYKPTVFEKVEITAAAAEGKSLARVDNRVIFVSNAVPGDVADIRITGKKKKFFEGTAIHFHTLSDKRTKPECKHFGLCGGCKWQHLDYQWQLHYKQQQVIDAFTRIGKFRAERILTGRRSAFIFPERLIKCSTWKNAGCRENFLNASGSSCVNSHLMKITLISISAIITA